MTSTTASVTVQPITPHLGAWASGVSIGADQDHAARELQKVLDDHLVVAVADQSVSPVELREFTRQLGPLFIHHADEGVLHCEDAPEVLRMLKEPDGDRLFGGGDWHADVTFRNPAGYASVLHAIELPPVGGDTCFSSTIAAFAALSDGMKETLRSLNAVHSYDGPGRPDHPDETATHPVVRAHPVTGKEGLYINRMFATRFEGMSQEESKPLIDFLGSHISRPEFGCRISWKPGQVVMWDNRFTLHYPSNDFTGHRRLLIRCTAMERT